MIVPTYTSGTWYAVVTDGAVALLAPETEPAVVTAVWDSLRAGEGVARQVELLIERGLRDAPPFALLSVRGGDAHLIVRGGVEAVVATGTGRRVLSGVQVATWSEELVPDPQEVRLRVAGAEPTPPLPALSAIVRADGVTLRLRDAVAAPAEGDRPARGTRSEDLDPAGTAPAEPAAGPDPLGDLANTVLQPTSQAVAGRARAEVPALPPLPRDLPGGDALGVLASLAAPPVPAPAPPAPAPPAPAPTATDAPAPPAGPGAVDHDGHTVLSSDVPVLRRQLPDWAGDAPPGPIAVPSPQSPPPGKIHLSTGLVVALNRTVLLGRAPQVSRVANAELPRLVTLPSPNQDISRTHAEVRQEGEHVVVTDLRSTNGVLLLREGANPQRLHPGVPTVVEAGVTVDLGDGVTFLVEHGR